MKAKTTKEITLDVLSDLIEMVKGDKAFVTALSINDYHAETTTLSTTKWKDYVRTGQRHITIDVQERF